MPKGITQPGGITPEPVQPAFVQAVIHGVLPADLGIQKRLPNRHMAAGKYAVAVNPLTGQTIQPFCNLGAFQLYHGRLAGLGIQRHSPYPKTVGGKLIAGTFNKKENLLPHQANLVKCGYPAAVGEKPNLAGSSQFHQRDPATGLLVEGFNKKRACNLRPAKQGKQEHSPCGRKNLPGKKTVHRNGP